MRRRSWRRDPPDEAEVMVLGRRLFQGRMAQGPDCGFCILVTEERAWRLDGTLKAWEEYKRGERAYIQCEYLYAYLYLYVPARRGLQPRESLKLTRLRPVETTLQPHGQRGRERASCIRPARALRVDSPP